MKLFRYIRVSTIDQTKGASFETQDEAGKIFCDRHGYIDAGKYIEHRSAKDHNARDQFTKMCQDLEKREYADVAGVLVYDLARISRNRTDWAYLKEQARNCAGVIILSATETISQDIHGDFQSDIKNAYSVYESGMNSTRVVANMVKWAERGITPGSIPRGYQRPRLTTARERGRIPEPNKDAPLIEKLFKRASTGLYNVSQLAEYAADIGLTLRGKMHHRQTIGRLLKNPFYIGKFVFRGTVYIGLHTPIISNDLFYAVQDVLNEGGRKQSKGNVDAFPLRGLVSCFDCGEAMTSYRVKKTYKRGHSDLWTYYTCYKKNSNKCSKTHRQSRIFAEAQSIFTPLKFTDIELSKIGTQVDHYLNERSASSKRDKSRLLLKEEELHELITKGVRRLTLGTFPGSEDSYLKQLKAWEHELDAVKTNLSALNNEQTVNTDELKVVLELISDLGSTYAGLNRLEKGRLLKIVCSNLLVGDGKLEPIYAEPFDAVANRGRSQNWCARKDSNP